MGPELIRYLTGTDKVILGLNLVLKVNLISNIDCKFEGGSVKIQAKYMVFVKLFW